MLLKDLFKNTSYKLNTEIENHNINRLVLDSREVKENDLFIAQQGFHVDSHAYAIECLNKGAFVVMDYTNPYLKNISVALEKRCIFVEDTKKLVAPLSKAYFNDPDESLNVIGVTGTNGKTSTTHMIKAILEKAGHKVGLIGTIHNMIGDIEKPSHNTTPGGFELYGLLREMNDAGCQFVVMEISSHALDLHRCTGLNLSTVILTNITIEHLDFHSNMESYIKSKLSIFDLLIQSHSSVKQALYNSQISYKEQVIDCIQNHKGVNALSYGINYCETDKADFSAEILKSTLSYSDVRIHYQNQSLELRIPMASHFNVENALAAFACCLLYHIDLSFIKEGLEYTTIKGRFENITPNEPFATIVDYAHTPDALENVLKAAKNLNPNRLIVIFGAGGDRDTSKRPMMGKIASLYADIVYITSDNPRSEDPTQIIKEINDGVCPSSKIIVHQEVSRKDAIEKALLQVQMNDIIIIAGKGHEDYQIFKHETIHFSDQETVKNFIIEG